MSRIYITGDTHGEWMSRLNSKLFVGQKELTKDDYIIILGDFGIWDGSKSEKYALDWLENKPFSTLFIDGNHENYDILEAVEQGEWHGGKVGFIRPSVLHLKRGQVYEIAGKKFFTFGGGSSHDLENLLDPEEPGFELKKKRMDRMHEFYRIKNKTWWERELPNKQEMEEGIENLQKNNFKVDYILSHTIYEGLRKPIDGGRGKYPADILTEYLQEIKDRTEYEHWFFGHFHDNQLIASENATCMYQEIKRIV